MSILKTIGGFLFGASPDSIVSRAADIADQYIEDTDQKNALIAELLRTRMAQAGKATLPWADALHKLGRQVFVMSLTGFYIYAKTHGIELDWQELLTVAGPGGAYILLKGRGA